MGFFDRFKKRNYEERAQVMKDLCLSFAADIRQRVLPDTGLSDKPIDAFQAIFFGMFIINTHYYNLSKGVSETTINQAKEFHRVMDNFFVNDIYLKTPNVKESRKTDDFLRIMSDQINLKYAEYDRLLKLDLKEGSRLYQNTIRAFANNLFSEEINEDKLSSFLFSTALIFAEHYLKCRDTFKQW